MEFDRKAIEVYKILNNLHNSKTPHIIEHDIQGKYSIGVDTFNTKSYCNDLYNSLKEFYFDEVLGNKTEIVEFDTTDEMYEILCKKSDERGITIDEYVVEILTDYMESDTCKGE